MTGRYKVYPEYKESDVEWLPELPANWNIERTKRMFSLKRSLVGNQSSNYQLLSLTLKGVIPRDISSGEGKIPESFDTYQKVDKNDLIFCLFDIDETPRTIGISPLNGMITGAYNVYGCLDNCFSDYAYYYFFHIDSFKGLKPFYTGLRKVVRAETFSNIEMPCPSFEEQQKIANFLDHETAKIDTLITKQEKLIELLKEKRQAVISHAVTKGLNPDAPMKDSGVEWLGEVPEHWDVTRFKFLCENIIAGPFGSSITKNMYVKSGFRVYGQEQVIPNDFDIGDYFISAEDYLSLARYKVNTGDVLISCVGTFGKVAVFPPTAQAGIINPRLIKAKIHKDSSPYFIREYLKSVTVAKQFDQFSRGGTMGVINIAILNEIDSTKPPYAEQFEIYDFIKAEKSKFSLLLNRCEKQIALLKERKTALISAAVTGKIDVRDWSEH